MDANNLNLLQKQDPSLAGGRFNVVFERKVPLDMQINDPSIREMVGEDISLIEEMNVKILARGKDTTVQVKHRATVGMPLSARLEDEQ